jgi:uncharacterized RDD family membrane protein YckC
MTTYAGFWKRAAAFALDYIIILFYLAALALIGLLINSLFSAASWLFSDRVRAQLSGFLLITLPVTLYFALSESSAQRATWGKKRLGLQVTDYNGGKLGFWRSLARTILKFIPWEISHTLIWAVAFSTVKNPVWLTYGIILVYALIGLNILCLVFTRKQQTMYDLIAKTYVIKQP